VNVCSANEAENKLCAQGDNMRQYWKRILTTLILIAFAYLAFILPPEPETITKTVNNTTIIETIHNRGQEFFKWIAILFLALSVWIWRDKLKITSVGPLSGPLLNQQTPEEIEKAYLLYEAPTPMTFEEARTKEKEAKFQEARAYVLNYLSKHNALNVFVLSSELGISNSYAKALLSSLVSEGKLRCDGFPRHTLYTLASSLENMAIDHIRDKFIAPNYRLLSERRFIKIRHKYEIDALLECEERTFLVEIKFFSSGSPSVQIAAGYEHLAEAAANFSQGLIAGYLVLVVKEPDNYEAVKRQVDRMTFDTQKLPLRCVVVSRKDLVSESGT
jgi:hypothetical protein